MRYLRAKRQVFWEEKQATTARRLYERSICRELRPKAAAFVRMGRGYAGRMPRDAGWRAAHFGPRGHLGGAMDDGATAALRFHPSGLTDAATNAPQSMPSNTPRAAARAAMCESHSHRIPRVASPVCRAGASVA